MQIDRCFLKELLAILDSKMAVPATVDDDVEFLAGKTRLGAGHTRLLSIFSCDIRRISGDAFNAQKLNGGSLSNQLEPLNRVYQVTPRYDEMNPLIADDLHSAKEIAGLSDEAFVQKFKNGVSEIKDAEKEVRLLSLFKQWLNWRISLLK